MVIHLQFMRIGVHTLPVPEYHSARASGLDLRSPVHVIIPAGHRWKCPTGWAVEIPDGYEGQIRPRSSMSDVGIITAIGTIDADYRGEMMVSLLNLNTEAPLRIDVGDRIAQLVIAPVARGVPYEVSKLSPTARGGGGFGSTGRQ